MSLEESNFQTCGNVFHHDSGSGWLQFTAASSEIKAGMFSSLDKNHLILASHVNKDVRSKQTQRAAGLPRSTERVLLQIRGLGCRAYMRALQWLLIILPGTIRVIFVIVFVFCNGCILTRFTFSVRGVGRLSFRLWGCKVKKRTTTS